MSRGVAYFNQNVRHKTKRLVNFFNFMQPESPTALRLRKLRVLNNGYKQFHN